MEQSKQSPLYEACQKAELNGKKMTKIERTFFLNQLGLSKDEISTITGSNVAWIGQVLKAFINEPQRIDGIKSKFPDYATKF